MPNEQAQVKPAEQRKETRSDHHSELLIRDPGRKPVVRGRMHNFSRGGIYFESDTFIPHDRTILIGIYHSPYSDDAISYECHRVKIKWCRSLGKGGLRYGYGAEKLDPVVGHLPENGPERSGDDPDSTSKERRKNARKAFLSSVYFVCDRKYYAGVTKDISSGGLFIRIEKPVKLGQILTLTIPNTDYEQGKMLRARVVHLESNGIGVKIVGIVKSKRHAKRRLDEPQKSG